MRSLEQIHSTVEALRRDAADRDARHKDVHDVRSGDVDTVIPGAMPDAWPRPIVANLIDTSARDFAETMGAMPTINCSSGSNSSNRSKQASSKKTKIASHYVSESKLQAGLQVTFADHYSTYGLGIYVISPDFERKMPVIRVENPMGTYLEVDFLGRVRSYTKVWTEEAIRLVTKFPHLLKVLQPRDHRGNAATTGWQEREIEVVKYQDGDQICMFLPRHGNVIIEHMENPLGKVFISPAFRPGYDDEIRGAFDDAVWVQLAKSRMALLAMEATEKSVRAPLQVPRDVQRMTFGDDAVIRTDGEVKRVGLDVPQYAFQEGAMMEQELRVATRAPEARSGNVDASIITGRGVQALMGGFNTVITTGQTVIAEALRKAIELCFEMDEKLWGGEKKTIRGTVQGTPFEETYTPSKDIKGDYTVDVRYGFAAGQDPARAIVGLLQLRGDQLISRDFFLRQLPMEIDITEMQTQVDLEQLNDAAKQGIMAYAQAILPMAQQGMMQDPTDALNRLAKVMDLRSKGTPIHEAMQEAFKVEEQPQQGIGGGMADLLGAGTGGPTQGAQAAPQGAPGGSQQQGGQDLMSLLSGLSGTGQATMSARTQRQAAI